MITSVKLFIGISNLRSNYSCLTRTVSSNILSVKFGWKIIAVFCMYFIIAVNIWIDIKIVILHHDGTPFVVLGHASVLYLQYGEYCDQWMRGEDSGDGIYYYPIEGSTQYFWVAYSF